MQKKHSHTQGKYSRLRCFPTANADKDIDTFIDTFIVSFSKNVSLASAVTSY